MSVTVISNIQIKPAEVEVINHGVYMVPEFFQENIDHQMEPLASLCAIDEEKHCISGIGAPTSDFAETINEAGQASMDGKSLHSQLHIIVSLRSQYSVSPLFKGSKDPVAPFFGNFQEDMDTESETETGN